MRMNQPQFCVPETSSLCCSMVGQSACGKTAVYKIILATYAATNIASILRICSAYSHIKSLISSHQHAAEPIRLVRGGSPCGGARLETGGRQRGYAGEKVSRTLIHYHACTLQLLSLVIYMSLYSFVLF